MAKTLFAPEDRERVIVRVTDLSRAGSGVARDDGGRVIFIPLTMPGDLVEVMIISHEKRYAQGEIVRMIEPAAGRVTPRCAVFSRCGGCTWQHIPYELQWKTKSRGVLHALQRVEIKIEEGELECFPADSPWSYRNRVQLRGFGEELGFYARGSNARVPASRCEIAREEINHAWDSIRREGADLPKPYKVEAEVIDGQVTRTWNSPHAAAGFRQINDAQNEVLRAWVAGQIPEGSRVFDLFGGNGNLSLGLASRMRQVDCVDIGSPLQAPAGTPAQMRFHRSPVAPWFARGGRGLKADVAILDPPREGLGEDHGKIQDALVEAGVSRVLAIGCDADSWARDVSRFIRKGWKIERVGAIDLFPQTPHVEAVAALTRPS